MVFSDPTAPLGLCLSCVASPRSMGVRPLSLEMWMGFDAKAAKRTAKVEEGMSLTEGTEGTE